MSIFKHFKPFRYLWILYISICALLRILLIHSPIIHGSFELLDYFKIFLLGGLSDTAIFFILGGLLWIYIIFLSDGKFRKPYGYIIFAALVCLFIYIAFFNNILKQYGSVVPLLGMLFVGAKTLIFGCMLFFPRSKKTLRLTFYFLTIFLFTALILINALSEYFFWNEFGVRYNFIAVDYLLYTNEVIGNIMESYPVIPLFSFLGIISLGISVFIVCRTKDYLDALPGFKMKLQLVGGYLCLLIISCWAIPRLAELESSENVFVNELQADGVYKFYRAFKDNKLDYFKFYATSWEDTAYNQLQKELPLTHPNSLLHRVQDPAAEDHKNVVLISVESLSADYLAHFGNKKHLTPFLDSLADQSLFFTNLYAVGNRTVRGLEALTLCLPPGPGESVIKQANNKNKFNVGYLFKERGYQVKFLYGGYSYFDNMQDFYEGNGYSVVDRSDFHPDQISFANIWGVCDGDMANKAIETMNKEASSGRPFFNHWMTVSNHRPFTYPNGKVAISGDAKSRDGGVMYTDYALRQFFNKAKGQPWFKNTVFIIVADHCASSAGRTALPLSKYRIPCIVYGADFIRPRQVNKLMSQIDIMPTVMSLLHFSYDSKFIGRNVFDPGYRERAFIATYQDLGLIKDSILTVLSPVRKVKQYKLSPDLLNGISPQFQYKYKQILLKVQNDSLRAAAIGYYQTTAWMLKNGRFHVNTGNIADK